MNDPSSPQGQVIAESRRRRIQQQEEYEAYSATIDAEQKAYEEARTDYYRTLKENNSDLGSGLSETALRFAEAARPVLETAEDKQYMKERLAAADMYSNLFNVSFENAFINLDNFHKQWIGQDFVKKSGFEAVRDSFQLSFLSREYNELAKRYANRKDEDPHLEKALQEYEQRMEKLRDRAPKVWQDNYVSMGGWDDVGQFLRSTGTSLAENAVPIAEGMAWAALSATGVGALGTAAKLSSATIKLLAAGASRTAIGASTYNSTWGMKYREMTNQGIPHDIAKNYAQLDALVEGIIEGSLGGVEAAGADAIMRTVVPEAVGRATTRFFVSGKMGNGAKAILNVLKQGAEEGSEELLQGNSSGAIFNAAAEKANTQREEYRENKLREIAAKPFGEMREELEKELEKYMEEHPEVEKKKWGEIFDEAIEGGIAGFLTGLILGIPIEITNYRTNVRSAMQLAEMAQAAPSDDALIESVELAKAQGIEFPILEGKKTDEVAAILSDVRKVQQERLTPEQREAIQKKAQDAEALAETVDYRDVETEEREIEYKDEETGETRKETRTELVMPDRSGIYFENDKLESNEYTDTNEDGSINRRTVFGDPRIEDEEESGINQYGFINSTEDGDTVTVNEFKVKGGYESLQQQMFDEFAEKYAGKNIVWNLKKSDALRDMLVNKNPRGPKEGLNYHENKNQIKISKEARQVIAKITSKSKNITPLEAASVAEFFHFARRKGESLYGAMNRLLGDVTNEAPNSVIAAQKAGQYVKGAFWLDKTAEGMKRFIYLNKHASDVSTLIHELLHSAEYGFTEAERKTAIETLNGRTLKNGAVVQFDLNTPFAKWTQEQRDLFSEAFAEAGEAYYLNGTAPNEQMKTIFERIKELMKRIYKTLTGWTELSPKVEEFYKSLFNGELTDQARTETGAQTHEESHNGAQTEKTLNDTERAGEATTAPRGNATTETHTATPDHTAERDNIISDPDIPLEEKTEPILDAAGEALYQAGEYDPNENPIEYLKANAQRLTDAAERERVIKEIDELARIYPPETNKYLAPNGKASNLNHAQWYAVRTGNFKEWFGDWESVVKIAEMEKNLNEYTDALEKAGKQDRETLLKNYDNTPEEDNSGRILLHKSLYKGKKNPYPNLTRVRSMSEGGVSPISHADQTAPGGSLSARDNNIIGYFTQPVNPESVSKIVDENGEPLALWHSGTFGTDDNYTPEGAMHFGTKKAAEERKALKPGEDLFRSIKVEYDEDQQGYYWKTDLEESEETYSTEKKARAAAEEAVRVQGDLIDEDFTDGWWADTQVFLSLKNIIRSTDQLDSWENVIKNAKEAGYDGIEYVNQVEDAGSTSYIAFNEDQIKSATDNAGAYDPGNSSILFQIIGEKGAEALDKANESTIRLDNLNIARRMEEAGKDVKVIRLATGWERGADGKWRYEIPDVHVDLDKFDYKKLGLKDPDDLLEVKRRLEDIADAPELFKAYPELKDAKVQVVHGDTLGQGINAYWDDNAKTLTLNRTLVGNEPGEIEKTIIHEIQHAVQDIEGFAQGGNPRGIDKFFRDKAVELINKFDDQQIKELQKWQRARRVLEYEINRYVPVSKWDSYEEVKILRQKIQEADNAFIEATGRETFATLSKVKTAHYDGERAHGLYHSLAGEVEARNAANRGSFTAAQRNETTLKETEDVAREDQIIIRDGIHIAQSLNEISNMLFQAADQTGEYDSAEVIDIDPTLITDENGNAVDLKDTRALTGWIRDRYQGMEITISDDGLHLTLTRDGIEASTKRRGEQQRQMYAGLDRLIESAVYDDFVKGDNAHPKVEKQNIYYAAARIGGKLYSVEIKVDIPFDKNKPNYYKDHKITEIKMEPSPYAGSSGAEVDDTSYRDESSISRINIDVLKGEVKPSRIEGNTLFQAAYHGSPYRFDRFDSTHMGEGEGAQAYGWGHYFAGKKEVAEWYKYWLEADHDYAIYEYEGNKYNYDGYNIINTETGEKSGRDNYLTLAIGQLRHDRKFGKSNTDGLTLTDEDIRNLENNLSKENTEKIIKKHNEARRILDKIKIQEPEHKGQLYEVEIPGDEEMLDWDKPLSEQPEKVKEALKEADPLHTVEWRSLPDGTKMLLSGYKDQYAVRKTGNKYLMGKIGYGETGNEHYIEQEGTYNTLKEAKSAAEKLARVELKKKLDNWSGSSFYHLLSMSDSRAASEYLNSLGIKGIRYLDGDSRAAGEGSHNYVIFNDASVNITNTLFQLSDEQKETLGDIKINTETGIIKLNHNPNNEQTDILREYIQQNNGNVTIDFEKNNIEYSGANPDRVLDDIKNYYEKGELPPEVPVLFQMAWNASVAMFDRFDNYYAGRSGLVNTHGWGHSFYSQREAADWFGKKLEEYKGASTWLYHARIPDDTDLLDWDTPLHSQPEAVRKAAIQLITWDSEGKSNFNEAYNLRKFKDGNYGFFRSINGKMKWATIEEAQTAAKSEIMKALDGRGFYAGIAKTLGEKNTSLLLDSMGIRGIKYLDRTVEKMGLQASHGYTVFGDQHIAMTPLLFQIEDRNMVEEAAGFNSWQEWKAYCEAMYFENPMGEHENEVDVWEPKEVFDAWYKAFWENSRKANKAANAETQETSTGERATPAELDREFIEEITGEGALENFVKTASAMYHEDYGNWGAITEEDAAERDRQSEISDNVRKVMKHPTWQSVFMAKGEMGQTQRKQLLTMIKHSPRDYRAIYAEVMEREDLTVSAEDRDAEILKYKITDPARRDEFDRMTPEKRRQLAEKIAIEEYSKLVDTGRAKFNDPVEKAYIKQLKDEITQKEEKLKESEANEQENNLYIERQAGTEFLKTFDRAVKASAFITIANEKLAKAIKTGDKDAARITRQLQRANSNYDSIVKTLEALKDVHKLEIDVQEALANEEIKDLKKSAKTQSTLQKHLAVKAAREKWTARLAELKEQQQAAKEVTKAKRGMIQRIFRKADARQVDAGHGMKMAIIQRFAEPSVKKGVNEFIGEIDKYDLRPVFEMYKVDEKLRNEILKDKLKATQNKIRRLFGKEKFEDLTTDERRYLSRKIAPMDWIEELGLDEISERRNENYPIGEAGKQIAQQILPPDVYYRIMDKPFSQWTLNEVEELAKIIDDLYVEGKQLYKANIDAERRRIREYQNAVKSTIRTVIKKGAVVTNRDEAEKILGKYKEGTKLKGPLFNYADMNVYRFARMLDNGDTNGKNMAALYRGAKDARNQELAAMNLRAKKVFDVMKKGKITEKDLWEKAFEINLGGDLGIKAYTAAEAMGFIYASQNDYSRHAVLGGNLLSEYERGEYQIHGITPEEVTPLNLLAGDRFAKVTEAARKFMADNPQFQKFMEVIGEDFAMSGERVGDYLIRYNNNVMRKEKNYFPMIRTQAVSANTADAKLVSELMGSSSGAFNVFVEKGFTKERNEIPIQYQTPIKLDMFGVWTEAMERQEHFISHGQLVKDLNQIYKNSRPVRDAVQRRYGQAAVKYIDKYINELANPNPDQIRSHMDKFVRTMRGNTAAAYLGWKVSGIVKQFITSPAPFFAYMNPLEYYAAQVEYAAKHTELWNEIVELSPYMGSRSSSLMIDLVKERAKHRSDNKAVNAINDFNKLGMKGLEIVDEVCVAPGWLVLFRKEQKRLTEGNANDTMSEKDIRVKAAQYADDIVGLTQPSSWHADLPPLFKGNSEFAKAFLQFTQSLSMIWQNIRYDMPQMIRDRRGWNAAGTIIGYTVAGIMLGAITAGFDDDDDTPEKKARRIAWWATMQFTDAFPALGSEVTRLTEQAFTGKKQYQGGWRNLLPVLEKIAGAGSTGITAIQEKDFEKFLRAAAQAAEAAAISKGLPLSGAKGFGALTGIGDGDGELDFYPQALAGRRKRR